MEKMLEVIRFSVGTLDSEGPSLLIFRWDLGEVIIKSGNEESINLVINLVMEFCYGYNFVQNLKYYLILRKARM